MAGTGFGQQLLTTLNGRLPTDEAQFQHVMEQLRRYGHMVEQHQPHAHQGRYMPIGIDLDDIHQNPWVDHSMHLPTGMTTSAGVGGGGVCGASPVDSGTPPPPAIAEHYSFADDSDTSDEESDGETDNYPDPHPADPDMTGWTSNQIGCYFYGRYKHFKKKWRNYQGVRKPPGHRLSRPRARAGRLSRRTTFAVNGRPRRGNPIGRDGNPLKCHRCGSTEHLQAKCHLPPRSSHNAVSNYDFTIIPEGTVISLDHAIVAVAQQSSYSATSDNMGIISNLGVRSPIIEEVTAEEPDPLQRDDPWSNALQDSYEVVPTHASPIADTTTTDSWSVYGSTQTSAAPAAAAEAASTTAVSQQAGVAPTALHPPNGEPPQMSPIPTPALPPLLTGAIPGLLSGMTSMPGARSPPMQSIPPNTTEAPSMGTVPASTTAGPTVLAPSLLFHGSMPRVSHPVAATSGSQLGTALGSALRHYAPVFTVTPGGNGTPYTGGNPTMDLLNQFNRLNRRHRAVKQQLSRHHQLLSKFDHGGNSLLMGHGLLSIRPLRQLRHL